MSDLKNDNLRIVEINGIKIEVDLRTAKVVTNYKVGDAVKVLIKEYSDSKVYPGLIVSFDNFKELPTITVAYLKTDYGNAEIKFVSINAKTVDTDIAPMNNVEKWLDKSHILTQLNSKISADQLKLDELVQRRDFFVSHYGAILDDIKEVNKNV